MFPELVTSLYILKQFEPADLPFIFKGLSDPQVVQYYGVRYATEEAAKAQVSFYDTILKEGTGCWWKIVDRQTGVPIGACGINHYQPAHEKAETGYWLLPAYQQQGVMAEVMPVLIKYVFNNWVLHRLEAVIEEGNTGSIRLAEKLGFVYEGRHRDAEIKEGRRITLLFYSLLKTDL